MAAGDSYRCPRCHIDHVVEQPFAHATTAERPYLNAICQRLPQARQRCAGSRWISEAHPIAGGRMTPAPALVSRVLGATVALGPTWGKGGGPRFQMPETPDFDQIALEIVTMLDGPSWTGSRPP